MSDQCASCTLRGDLPKCLASGCRTEDWIVEALREALACKQDVIEAQSRILLSVTTERDLLRKTVDLGGKS